MICLTNSVTIADGGLRGEVEERRGDDAHSSPAIRDDEKLGAFGVPDRYFGFTAVALNTVLTVPPGNHAAVPAGTDVV